VLVGFVAGSLLGATFLHLIPEVVEVDPRFDIFIFALLGFASFFLLEKFCIGIISIAQTANAKFKHWLI